MGYYIRALSWKKSEPKWKVQFISYKNIDIVNSKSKTPKKEWDIRPERWRALGFHTRMTIEEARVRAKQLNAQRFVKRQEQRIKELEQKNLELLRKNEAFLPEEFVAEFETRFLRVRDSETVSGKRKKARTRIIWSAAQRMITDIKVDPSEWFFYTHEIYDHFYLKRYSVRYIHAILKLANLWGFYISKKLALPFLPIPQPRGFERMRLIEANYEKNSQSIRRASKPLTPKQLDIAKQRINQANYNWLFLSVWFGLRPLEIDNLKNPTHWRVEKLSNGKKILWVFQTKIISLPIEDRWKPIPIIFDEQKFALRILQSQNFRRPIGKTMRRHFGLGIDLYGGRKGFTDLMLSMGHKFENISVWLGHSTLNRTWTSYKSRRGFHL